jgi:hypothetical protein
MKSNKLSLFYLFLPAIISLMIGCTGVKTLLEDKLDHIPNYPPTNFSINILSIIDERKELKEDSVDITLQQYRGLIAERIEKSNSFKDVKMDDIADKERNNLQIHLIKANQKLIDKYNFPVTSILYFTPLIAGLITNSSPALIAGAAGGLYGLIQIIKGDWKWYCDSYIETYCELKTPENKILWKDVISFKRSFTFPEKEEVSLGSYWTGSGNLMTQIGEYKYNQDKLALMDFLGCIYEVADRITQKTVLNNK